MSLETPLYFYRNLNQAPGLALNAVGPYAQGVSYLKTKTAHFLNTCSNQLQSTINVVYPILRHPRSSTISAILLSTKYMANLTGMTCIYQKSCHILSRRSGQITSIENQLLLKLKKLSNYCIQLNTRHIPWQKIPELQALEELKEELLNNQQTDPRSELTEAISCCDEIYALVALYRSISSIEDLNPEEMHSIEESTDAIFSAIEENTGEALGSYTPSLLAPIFNDVLNSIPKSYNPLTLVNTSLMTTLKKISLTVGSSSFLTVTSSNYFISSNAQKTLLQLCSISGMSAVALYYQEQVEETAKEILQMFLEITCAYAGMLLFKTDESFKYYFHKIIPAIAASRATEYCLGYTESSTITFFALPLLVSSLVYNQASIQETYQQFKTFPVLSGELKRQLLQAVAPLITDHITNCSSSGLSQIALEKVLEPARHAYPMLDEIFTPLFLPVMNQLLAQPLEQQALQTLSFSKEYLTILQQDDMQELLLKIQNKLSKLDPEVEELKNQFLREVFLKKTGTPLPLGNAMLNLLKKSSGMDIQAALFTSFKNAPPAIRMLWNSYSYHKKVDQTLTLELLLQGLVISGLADLMLGSNAAELPSFSYVKTAGLGISLAL